MRKHNTKLTKEGTVDKNWRRLKELIYWTVFKVNLVTLFMTPAGYYCLCNGDMDLSFTSIKVISSLTSSFITRILVNLINKLSSVPLQFIYT